MTLTMLYPPLLLSLQSGAPSGPASSWPDLLTGAGLILVGHLVAFGLRWLDRNQDRRIAEDARKEERQVAARREQADAIASLLRAFEDAQRDFLGSIVDSGPDERMVDPDYARRRRREVDRDLLHCKTLVPFEAMAAASALNGELKNLSQKRWGPSEDLARWVESHWSPHVAKMVAQARILRGYGDEGAAAREMMRSMSQHGGKGRN